MLYYSLYITTGIFKRRYHLSIRYLGATYFGYRYLNNEFLGKRRLSGRCLGRRRL